jgi:hypothetical protein
MTDTIDRDTKRGAIQAKPPELAFVESALHDLQRSQVSLSPGLCDRWVPTAFNDWYCPVVRRGYVGGFAPVFDIGVALMEPAARIRADDGHGKLLQWLLENPVMRDFAARASGRFPVPTPNEAFSVVTWTMVEPLLRCLLGVWDSAAVAAVAGRELPRIEYRRNLLLIYDTGYGNPPVHELAIGSIELGEPPQPSVRGAAPAASADENVRRVTGCVLPGVQTFGVRLFAAQVARLLPEFVHKLDHELAEACLLGPVLGERDQEPPPRSPIDVSTTQQSQQPGGIAGVTRVETRRPNDPLVDILPSELMLLRRSRMAGFAHVLYGKPLVVVHERERDIVPKHRALVCYIVDAHQNMMSNHRDLFAERAGDCRYRDVYVYAKRQVFDMLHDLADAQALARRTTDVEVEAAVFAIAPGSDHAVVHQRISLENLKRAATGDGKIDRLTELVRMADLVPGYFIRYAAEPDRSRPLATGRAVDVLPSDAAQYLRKASRLGRFRVIHLVVVGVDKASHLLERLYRYLHHQTSTPMRISLIGVSLDALDSDVRLVSLREPAWTYLEVASLREAIALSEEPLEPTALSELRARFVESVFGQEIKPTAAQLGRIQSS